MMDESAFTSFKTTFGLAVPKRIILSSPHGPGDLLQRKHPDLRHHVVIIDAKMHSDKE